MSAWNHSETPLARRGILGLLVKSCLCVHSWKKNKEYNICLSVCIEMQRIPLMLCWHLCLALLARLMCVSSNCPADRGLYCICNYTGKSVPLSCGLVTLCVCTEKGHAGSPSKVSHRIQVQSVPPPAFDRRLGDVMIEAGRKRAVEPWTFNSFSAGPPGDKARHRAPHWATNPCSPHTRMQSIL